MSASNTLEQNIWKAIFQHTPYDAGANVYIGLANAFSDSAYTEIPNTGSYARVTVPANATNFPFSSGVGSNGIAIVFPSPTGSWGTPKFVFAATSASWNSAVSTILTYQAIPAPIVISSGDPAPRFDIGLLAWSVD